MKAVEFFGWATTFWSIVPIQRHEVAASPMYDTFTFRETNWDNRVFGPEDWNFVTCHDVDSCPGWPTNWEDFNSFIPYEGTKNMCHDCSEITSGVCRRHQQSPIHLFRNVTGDKACKDRHKMGNQEGNCRWDDMEFKVLPHVLRAYQPEYCQREPVIDFSWGFPDWWEMKFTDIVVPSHHAQDGKEYAAEIIMSHVYSKDKYNKLIGNVAVFLEEGADEDHYDFLELWIKRFSHEAKKIENHCAAQRKLKLKSDPDIDADAKVYGTFTTNQSDIIWLRGLEDVLPIDFIDNPGVYVGNFDPYAWYKKCGTQYYFRYNGSMAEPPCFEGVHWRVMKDAIKVSPKQISKLERLFTRRLNPETCEADTAGSPRNDGSGRVNLNRPKQTLRDQHRLVYCECVDWESHWPNDVAYCKKSKEERGVVDGEWSTPASRPPTSSPSSSPTSSPSRPPTSSPSNRPSKSIEPSACTCDPPE